MTTKTKKPTPGGCTVIPSLLEQVLAAPDSILVGIKEAV